jgi:hypothetical protein
MCKTMLHINLFISTQIFIFQCRCATVLPPCPRSGRRLFLWKQGEGTGSLPLRGQGKIPKWDPHRRKLLFIVTQFIIPSSKYY